MSNWLDQPDDEDDRGDDIVDFWTVYQAECPHCLRTIEVDYMPSAGEVIVCDGCDGECRCGDVTENHYPDLDDD